MSHELITIDENTIGCPECGRRIQLEPFEILEQGDLTVNHGNWSKGGMELSAKVRKETVH
jgi:hypothetical protein